MNNNKDAKSLDDVRYRTRMSIAGDLATMARVGGNVIYSTGQGIGQGISAVIDAYNWINEDNEKEEIQPPMNEEVYEQTQGLMRRGASRSRSPEPEPEERASGSNDASADASRGSRDAIRLLRRGQVEAEVKHHRRKNNVSNIHDDRGH